MAISPDGSNLVYVAGTAGRIQLWLRPLNALHATPIPGTEGGYGPAFSPDGRSIAFMTGSGLTPLRVISLTGEPPITLTDSARWFNPAWSDDGWVYFSNVRWGLSRVPAIGGAVEVLSEPDSARGETIHHWPECIADLDESYAGLLPCLDLVISVCTSAVHACGALGVPCWCLVPSRPAWRYGVTGPNPWYGSVSSYRQIEGDTWSPVLEQVATDLEGFLRERQAA